MKDNAREFIVKSLRQALLNTGKVPQPPANPSGSHFRLEHSDDMVLNFVKKFMLCGGNLNYGTTNSEVADILNHWVHQNNIGTVECGTSELVNYIRNLNLEAENYATIAESKCRFGVLLCETLVAWDGSVVMSSDCFEDKEKIIIPENTVMVAFSSQVVPDFRTYITRKSKDGNMPRQLQILYPENIDHKKTQMLLIEDQN